MCVYFEKQQGNSPLNATISRDVLNTAEGHNGRDPGATSCSPALQLDEDEQTV